MQHSVFQTTECGMKTKKFLQGERKKTIIGELHNRVAEREIERTLKLKTDVNSSRIARVIYEKLKDNSAKDAFSLIKFGIIHSIILQTQYSVYEQNQPCKTKITVNLYGRFQAAVKIKSPTVRKYKKVKVKEERKFFIPYINGQKPENDIQDILHENVAKSLKEGNSWEKEKYQIFVEFERNIFTIAVSQISLLQEKEHLGDVQSNVPLIRIEVEYQGTQYSDCTGNVQAKEGEEAGMQDINEADKKIEKEISRQIRKIFQRVLEICNKELSEGV